MNECNSIEGSSTEPNPIKNNSHEAIDKTVLSEISTKQNSWN